MINRLKFASCVMMFALATGGCADSSDGVDDDTELAQDLASIKTPLAIIEGVFKESVRHKPTYAVFGTDGDRSKDSDMDPLSKGEFKKYYARMKVLGKKLATIDISKLTPSQQLAHDIATAAVLDAAARSAASYETWEMNTLYDEGDDIPYYGNVGPIRNRADLVHLKSRLGQLNRYFNEKIENYSDGIANGRVAPKTVVQIVINKNKALYSVPSSDANNAILANLAFDEKVSEADKTAWKAEIATVVDNVVNPSGLRWVRFLETKLLPKARTRTFGVGALDVGPAFYAGQVAFHTGDSRTPNELHTLGKTRVAELETAMKAELAKVGINEPTLAAGLAKAKLLPASAPVSETVVKQHVETDLIPVLSGTTWATGVWGVSAPPPVSIEYRPDAGSAVYMGGVKKIRIYTKDASLVTLDSIVVHEYTHYLQELTTSANAPISPVQQFFGGASMAEGAALYSEIYALDNGFYKSTDTAKLAMTRLNALSNLMLRAVRLVVDTGIHAKGWSRQEAINYMTARLTDSKEGIESQVDRYAGFPGQALAYRVGVEAILAEQTRAKQALGSKFKPQAFNQMVLWVSGGSGTLLHKKTDLFIATAK